MYRATEAPPKRVVGRIRSRWTAIGVGLVMVGVAVATRLVITPRADAALTLLLLTPSIILASTLGGAGPGLAVTCIAALAGAQMWGRAEPPFVDLTIFVVVASAICLAGERTRSIRLRHEEDARRLREREAHLQSILDTVPDGMVVIDDTGAIRSFSAAAERLFGWRASELLGGPVDVLMGPPYHDAHTGYMSHYAQTGERRIIGVGRVVEGLRRDGSSFRMHLSVGEMHVGESRYFTGFVRDLTEREQTESRLRDLQAELVHVSRLTAMGEMASALAHELNQPLSAIANYLRGSRRLLEKGDPADRPRLSEALGKAADQAMRAGDVIHRLRDFVGRGETEKTIENLGRLVEETQELALIGARELGVRVTTQFDPRHERALVDRVQIQQVLINLMRNAMDSMRHSPRRDLEITLAGALNGMILVSVSDTGAGIAPETMAKLFRPFMTTKKDGMGVGLSICRTIIEAHGGTIWADANPGGGATFHFTLPSANETEVHD